MHRHNKNWKSAIARLITWLKTPIFVRQEKEEPYSCRAGEKAYYQKDDFNPYREGTESHANWTQGYKSAERLERNCW